ncbi:MAG: CarD family transcriptional regulator [Defluviitaleaceae bacterium]|nr:CarD family transcriptional regulator [Defluviitaleaceae bacterium]
MYKIGDAVVYPMHGAGFIEDFEVKNIDGVSRNYCILRFPLGDLKIMLCEDSLPHINMRRIMPPDDIAETLTRITRKKLGAGSDNWSQRYKDNLERIKTGLLQESASVFYELHCRERLKGLSGAEKKIMITAKKVILSEIMISYNIEKNIAEEILESYLEQKVAM